MDIAILSNLRTLSIYVLLRKCIFRSPSRESTKNHITMYRVIQWNSRSWKIHNPGSIHRGEVRKTGRGVWNQHVSRNCFSYNLIFLKVCLYRCGYVFSTYIHINITLWHWPQTWQKINMICSTWWIDSWHKIQSFRSVLLVGCVTKISNFKENSMRYLPLSSCP